MQDAPFSVQFSVMQSGLQTKVFVEVIRDTLDKIVLKSYQPDFSFFEVPERPIKQY